MHSGTITFTPWLRSRSRAHTTLHVLGVDNDVDNPQHRGLGESTWRIAADNHLITVQTQDARVRWALPPAALDDALARLTIPRAR